MILLPPQVYRDFHRRIAIARRMRSKMRTRVPRNLFGVSDHRENQRIVQEALDEEQARFQKRWAVEQSSDNEDDKENGSRGCNLNITPKKRSSPYTKQRNVHEFRRSSKVHESNKSSPAANSDAPRPVLQSPPQMQSLSLSSTEESQAPVLADAGRADDQLGEQLDDLESSTN